MTMPKAAPRNLTGAELLLLAALKLHNDNCLRTQEFTEFDLTIVAWTNNRKRFGMRGYEHLYPDHKRVYSELVSTKPSSPVYKGHMVKTRPNVYRLTAAGVQAAFLLRKRAEGSRG